MIVVAASWFFMINENEKQVSEIISEREESKPVLEMRNAVHEQHSTLSLLVTAIDKTSQEDERLYLEEQIRIFEKARNQFVAHLDEKKFPKEFAIWREINTAISQVQHWQDRVVDLSFKQQTEQAHETLHHMATPAFHDLTAHLTRLFSQQQQHIENSVLSNAKNNQSGLFTLLTILTLSIIWCIFIAFRTIQRATIAEQLLLEERRKAQKESQRKSEFLANMSHEIRTPLAAIIGFSEALIEGEVSDNDKPQLDSIIRNGQHLHQIIDDILDLSKIEANEFSIEKMPTSICQMLTEIESLMGMRARDKGLHFEIVRQYPIPQQIISDQTRLKQILINLCGNAIKFTASGRVSIKTHYEEKNNLFYFDIEDSGIGLSQSQIASLFTPFKQADASTTRQYGGTGLGLYISKQFATILGGDINVSSLPGLGSRFSVSIDAGDISQSQWINSESDIENNIRPLHSAENVPQLKGKILLAEDNLDNQRLISMHIKKTGADITIVKNGKLAVEHALKQPFDLILMDMQMPVMNGIEAITKLREKNCTTPIAMLTANAMKKDAIQAESAGANIFLTKPINKQAFYEVLIRYLTPASTTQHTSDINVSCGNDLDDISDLIEKYVRDLSETSDRISQLLSTNNWQELRNEIHQLKGTGSAFGFPEITSRCTDIENQMQENNFNAASELISNLNSTCRTIAAKNTG